MNNSKENMSCFAYRFQNLIWFVWGSIWKLYLAELCEFLITAHASFPCVFCCYTCGCISLSCYIFSVYWACVCSVSFIPNALSLELLPPLLFFFWYYHSCIVIVFSNLGLLCDLKKYVPMFCILLKYILEIRLNVFAL